MAFKIVEDAFGQLTFIRIYQGKVKRAKCYFNQRTGKQDRFSRIVKMHANKREEIDSAEAGDIVAIMGIDCAERRHIRERDQSTARSKASTSPKPVIKLSITPVGATASRRLRKALQRFRKEDPTFNVLTDEETVKPSSRAWVSCILKSTSNASTRVQG